MTDRTEKLAAIGEMTRRLMDGEMSVPAHYRTAPLLFVLTDVLFLMPVKAREDWLPAAVCRLTDWSSRALASKDTAMFLELNRLALNLLAGTETSETLAALHFKLASRDRYKGEVLRHPWPGDDNWWHNVTAQR